ncbi:ferritin-like domain-containing protein [Rhodovibrionaceae bacterium A322]
MADLTLYPVSTVSQLLAVAVRFERQAAEGYGLVAQNLSLLGEDDGAALFRDLAEEEKHHAAQVEAAFGAEGEQLLSAEQLAALPQDLLDGFARTEFELLISPYRALAAAVRREELAFSFYSQVSAFSDDPDVVQMAEKLAAEELEHASLFREARRRAFRLGRQEAQALHCPDPKDLPDRQTLSRALQPHEKQLHLFLEEELARQEGAQALEQTVALSEKILKLLDRQPDVSDGTSGQSAAVETAGGQQHSHGDLLRQAARAFDFYDRLFTRAATEDLMIFAQDLSQLALERVGLLQSWCLKQTEQAR